MSACPPCLLGLAACAGTTRPGLCAKVAQGDEAYAALVRRLSGNQPEDDALAAVFACPFRSRTKCGKVNCLGGRHDGQRVTLDRCLACVAAG